MATALHRCPDVTAALKELGHEFACHGLKWIHYQHVDEATERAHMAQAMQIIEDLTGSRFTFYAPQVWTRQRKILMPTASILGTHLCNAFEVARMNDMIAAGLLEVTEPEVVGWDGLPEAHQSMWDNRHSGATYVVNHALPAMGLRSRDALLEAWAVTQAEGADA